MNSQQPKRKSNQNNDKKLIPSWRTTTKLPILFQCCHTPQKSNWWVTGSKVKLMNPALVRWQIALPLPKSRKCTIQKKVWKNQLPASPLFEQSNPQHRYPLKVSVPLTIEAKVGEWEDTIIWRGKWGRRVWEGINNRGAKGKNSEHRYPRQKIGNLDIKRLVIHFKTEAWVLFEN